MPDDTVSKLAVQIPGYGKERFFDQAFGVINIRQ
jgi:hypothetical protein